MEEYAFALKLGRNSYILFTIRLALVLSWHKEEFVCQLSKRNKHCRLKKKT